MKSITPVPPEFKRLYSTASISNQGVYIFPLLGGGGQEFVLGISVEKMFDQFGSQNNKVINFGFHEMHWRHVCTFLR